MFSQKQIEEMISSGITPEYILEKLVGQDINVDGITSHGIANTGSFGNIGDAVVSGNMYIQEDTEDSGNLEVEGAVKAKTLEQTEPNWSADLELLPTNQVTSAGLTGEQVYAGLKIFNNILYIVCIFKITNATGAAVSLNTAFGGYQDITLPEEIAQKIVDLTGKTAAEANSARVLTQLNVCSNSLGGTRQCYLQVDNKNTANQISVSVRQYETNNLADGTSISLEARAFMIL